MHATIINKNTMGKDVHEFNERTEENSVFFIAKIHSQQHAKNPRKEKTQKKDIKKDSKGFTRGLVKTDE